MDKFCLFAILGLTVLAGVIVLAFLDYKGKMNKKGIELEKSDKHQCQRIQELEKKNGHEQKQINELRTEVKELKEIIKRTKTSI